MLFDTVANLTTPIDPLLHGFYISGLTILLERVLLTAISHENTKFMERLRDIIQTQTTIIKLNKERRSLACLHDNLYILSCFAMIFSNKIFKLAEA